MQRLHDLPQGDADVHETCGEASNLVNDYFLHSCEPIHDVPPGLGV